MTVKEFLTQNNLFISELDVAETIDNNYIIFNIICSDSVVHELDIDYSNILTGSMLNRKLNFTLINDIVNCEGATLDLNNTNMANTPTNGLG